MKKIILLFCITSSFLSFGQAFNELKSGTSEALGTIRFTDNNTGYVAGSSGVIKRTTDAGATWIKVNSGTSQDISDMLFKNKDTGYCSARGGVILKTTDAGATWNKLNSGVYTDLSRIAFTSNAIFIAGYSGLILRSMDDGATWKKLNSTSSTYLYGISFLNDSLGFISGFGVILKTLDGGNTWKGLNCPTTTHLFSIYAKNNMNLMIVGGSIPDNEGHLVSTKDGGATWNLTKFKNTFLGTIEFIDANTGYISGGDTKANTSTIYKTMNNGNTWKIQQSNSKRQFGASFPSLNVGYTCGLNGTVLKTKDIITGLKEVESTSRVSLEVFPNPTTDILKLKLINGNNSKATISFLDANGKKVLSQEYADEINISAFAKGIYFVQVTIGSSSITKRFIKK